MKIILYSTIMLLLSSLVVGAPSMGKQPSTNFVGSWPYQAAYTSISVDSKTGQYSLFFDIHDNVGDYRGSSSIVFSLDEPLSSIDDKVDGELWAAFYNDLGGYDNAVNYVFKNRYYRAYSYGGACFQ